MPFDSRGQFIPFADGKWPADTLTPSAAELASLVGPMLEDISSRAGASHLPPGHAIRGASPHLRAGPRIPREAFAFSISALAFQIRDMAGVDASLLTDNAALRGEWMFADSGVPLPRPSTAIAWASLCAIGPSNDWRFNISSNTFLIPFLPSLRHGEDTTQSLPRTAKQHRRDAEGRITWGRIYLADAADGRIIDALDQGAVVATEFMHKRFDPLIGWAPRASLPPLWGSFDEGWQFGIVQSIPSIRLSLRDPMIFLAQRGIPETLNLAPGIPRIKRLLLRFLDLAAVRRWAAAYSDAMREIHAAYTISADAAMGVIRADIKRLADEVAEKEAQRFKDQAKDRAGSGKARIISKDDAEDFL